MPIDQRTAVWVFLFENYALDHDNCYILLKQMYTFYKLSAKKSKYKKKKQSRLLSFSQLLMFWKFTVRGERIFVEILPFVVFFFFYF